MDLNLVAGNGEVFTVPGLQIQLNSTCQCVCALYLDLAKSGQDAEKNQPTLMVSISTWSALLISGHSTGDQ